MTDLDRLAATVAAIKADIAPILAHDAHKAQLDADLARAENATEATAGALYAELTRYWLVQIKPGLKAG